MIIVVAGTFDVYKQGIKVGTEYVASHGIDENDRTVILQCVHPRELGAIYDQESGYWIIK